MWVAVALGAWLLLSLLAGPWIGRFIALHAAARDRPQAEPARPEKLPGSTEAVRLRA